MCARGTPPTPPARSSSPGRRRPSSTRRRAASAAMRRTSAARRRSSPRTIAAMASVGRVVTTHQPPVSGRASPRCSTTASVSTSAQWRSSSTRIERPFGVEQGEQARHRFAEQQRRVVGRRRRAPRRHEPSELTLEPGEARVVGNGPVAEGGEERLGQRPERHGAPDRHGPARERHRRRRRRPRSRRAAATCRSRRRPRARSRRRAARSGPRSDRAVRVSSSARPTSEGHSTRVHAVTSACRCGSARRGRTRWLNRSSIR